MGALYKTALPFLTRQVLVKRSHADSHCGVMCFILNWWLQLRALVRFANGRETPTLWGPEEETGVQPRRSKQGEWERLKKTCNQKPSLGKDQVLNQNTNTLHLLTNCPWGKCLLNDFAVLFLTLKPLFKGITLLHQSTTCGSAPINSCPEVKDCYPLPETTKACTLPAALQAHLTLAEIRTTGEDLHHRHQPRGPEALGCTKTPIRPATAVVRLPYGLARSLQAPTALSELMMALDHPAHCTAAS